MSKELVPQAQELVEEQPVRIINVWNQKDRSQQEVHTAARTWGEFKREQKSEINFKNLRGVVRHNKNILEVDDAVLPEESFSMFLFPQKVKSGMRTREEYEKTFGTAKLLRAECVKRGLGSEGTKQTFLDKLVAADKAEHEKKPITVKPPIKSKAIAKAPKVPSEIVVAEKQETIFPATIEKATVTTEMTLRITDKNALGDLLAVQFPGMEVVEIDAMISLKATLVMGVPQQVTQPPPAPVVEEDEPAQEPEPVVEKKAAPKSELETTPAPASKKTPLPPAMADTKKKKKKVHAVPTKNQFKKEADDFAKDFL